MPIVTGLVAASLAALPSQLPAAKPAPAGGVAAAAVQILRQRLSDGAIVTGDPTVQRARLVPYFASIGARGIAVAYGVTKGHRCLDAARAWAAWYEAHMNPDGTVYDYFGGPGRWTNEKDYDSTDSYAGTYLELLDALHAQQADSAWLSKRWPFVVKAVGAIHLTLQPNGLTLAKPTWPMMYTMDNTETALGLRSAAAIADQTGHKAEARDWKRMADRMQAAVSTELWDSEGACYRIATQTDGGKTNGLDKWYPDVMANLMGIAWMPPSDRNRTLLRRLKEKFANSIPAQAHTEDDVGALVWWGFAARTAGDQALLARVRKALIEFPWRTVVVNNPATAGEACRLMAGSLDRAMRR